MGNVMNAIGSQITCFPPSSNIHCLGISSLKWDDKVNNCLSNLCWARVGRYFSNWEWLHDCEMQLSREAVGGLIANTKKKKQNQEKWSTGVTNAPTLCQLMERMDVFPSSWIHVKHEKDLLTAHSLRRNTNVTVSVSLCDVWWRFG